MVTNMIGLRIQQAREYRRLSLETLAEKLSNSSLQAVTYYEEGERVPGSDVLLEISSALQVPLAFFFQAATAALFQTEINTLRPDKTLMTTAGIWTLLHLGGILDQALRLMNSFTLPDLALPDLVVPEWSELEASGVVIQPLDSDWVEDVYEMRSRYPALSVGDLSALILSREMYVVLLTEQSRLVEAAQNEDVEVRGISWLLDEMVEKGKITPEQAAAAQAKLKAAGVAPG